MKSRISIRILLTGLFLLIFTFNIFARTNLSYSEWYYNKFGNYPDGTVKDWESDPVYSQYLNEIGEQGIDNNVDGRSGRQKEYSDKYYPTVDDAWWNGRTAKWKKSGYVDRYEVRLYRDGNLVTTKTTKSTSLSFVNNMNRGGDHDYRFEVRAYNATTGHWSNWESSDDIEVNGNNPNVNPSNTDVGPGIITPTKPAQNTQLGRWFQTNGFWYYIFNSNNKVAANTWLLIAGKWYYFMADGRMATGLININGKQYFLNNDGSMATGAVIINGVQHFFNNDGSMAY